MNPRALPIGTPPETPPDTVRVEAADLQALELRIEQTRRDYLEAMRPTLREMQSQHPQGVVEPLYLLNGLQGPEEFRLYRYDFGYREDDRLEVRDFNMEAPTGGAGVSCTLASGLELVLHPFVWNGATLRSRGRVDLERPVSSWLRRWQDPEDGNNPDADGLGGTVHSVTVEASGDSATVEVDFGSAPPEAFWDLVGELGKAKVQHLEVASPHLHE